MLSMQPVPTTLLVFNLKTVCQKNRKKALCLTLALGMRCIIIALQFQHTRILTDLFLPSEIQVWAVFMDIDVTLHLTAKRQIKVNHNCSF